MLKVEIECDPDVGKSLVRFHQRLKICAGMEDRVLSCQRRISNLTKQGRQRSAGGPNQPSSQEKTDKRKDNAVFGKKRGRQEIDEERGKNITCFNCQKTGHPRRLCPDNKSDKKQKGSRYTAVYALSLSAERSIFIQIGPELRVPAVVDSEWG